MAGKRRRSSSATSVVLNIPPKMPPHPSGTPSGANAVASEARRCDNAEADVSPSNQTTTPKRIDREMARQPAFRECWRAGFLSRPVRCAWGGKTPRPE